MKGEFNDVTDSFNAAYHMVDVAAVPGSGVRKAVREQAQVDEIYTSKPSPVIQQYRDNYSGIKNSIITASKIGSLQGLNLRFNPDEGSEGIILINAFDGSEIKVEEVQRNQPSELVFLNPNTISKDEQYYITVRTRFNERKELREWRFDSLLTVE